MQLENQCCSLQQSKRLKELGVEQISVACYIGDELHLFVKAFYDWAEQKNMSAAAAYTVAELGVMLPRNFASFYCGYDIWRIANTFDYANGFCTDNIGEAYTGTSKSYVGITTSNEATTRAAMLIHLLENNHITAEEVNQRLSAA